MLPVFAWEADDIVVDEEGQEIIVPLQQPQIQIGQAFSLDSEAADHAGNKGGVYTGQVSVTKQGEQTIMATISDYHFNEGSYRLSVWFKEDNSNPQSAGNPDGAVNMTRMIRPQIGGKDTIKQDSTYLFFTEKSAGLERGAWTQAVLEFEVSTANASNAYCIGKPSVDIKWECASTWDGEPYEDRNKNADYFISFSDLTIFKYPSSALSLDRTNSGEMVGAQEGAFEAEFSAPIDRSSVKNITVNGHPRSAEALEIQTDGNKLNVSPRGGFPPGKTYRICIDGISDIFGRAYETTVAGTIAVQDYLTVDYKGKKKSSAVFHVSNHMKNNADFVIAVFYYSENRVKHVFYSQDIKAVSPGTTVEVSVPVRDGLSDLSVKAQIWDISAFVPMPLSPEIEL